jgi:hypothetical protein
VLENALPDIARQEQAIHLCGRQSGEKPKLGRREILGFVDDDVVERLVLTRRQLVGQTAEDVCPGRIVFRRQGVAHGLEHRPQPRAHWGRVRRQASMTLVHSDNRNRAVKPLRPAVAAAARRRSRSTVSLAMRGRTPCSS